MSVFAVDSDALISQSSNVRATSDRIRTEVNTMLAQLLQLQPVWQGAAAAGFQGVVEQWRAAQLNMEESLTSIGQALNVAGSQYAETEQAAAGMFR
ncbi:WXG100 family type VII secretion target [Microbacterium betulae]|uniref:ESAT-6-like protein n=1 Tax=Microbacterium betulae TaxID=2981139 RepID=A0AA97I753_9MICO|nr:WXG100 family type VII secretion target [Microbacterium sp. AB]WOF23877.1 WXG100 family type VII secretion target [Microbacterium sp. AB]